MIQHSRDKIEVQGNIIQKSIEWESMIDITLIETSYEEMKTIFDNIIKTITFTKNTISSINERYIKLIGNE